MVRNNNNVMISKDEYNCLIEKAKKICSESDPDMILPVKLLLDVARNEILAYLGFLLFENKEENNDVINSF